MAPSRSPKYRRSPTPPPLAITPRDIEIIKRVYDFRFLTSNHIAALVGGSRDKIIRRLGRLFHAGYLDRPRAQLRFYRGPGSMPMIYALGDRAEGVLREAGIHPRRRRWQSGNRTAKKDFFDHTLGVADFMVAAEVACRGREDVVFHGQADVLRTAPTAFEKGFPAWRVCFSGYGDRFQDEGLGVVPDQVFALSFPTRRRYPRRALYFAEIDRSTMPVYTANLRRSSIRRKIIAYEESFHQAVPENRFGFQHGVRVLFVVPSKERANHAAAVTRRVIEAQPNALTNKKRYLFAVKSEVSSDPLGTIWMNHKDDSSAGLLD